MNSHRPFKKRATSNFTELKKNTQKLYIYYIVIVCPGSYAVHTAFYEALTPSVGHSPLSAQECLFKIIGQTSQKSA